MQTQERLTLACSQEIVGTTRGRQVPQRLPQVRVDALMWATTVAWTCSHLIWTVCLVKTRPTWIWLRTAPSQSSQRANRSLELSQSLKYQCMLTSKLKSSVRVDSIWSIESTTQESLKITACKRSVLMTTWQEKMTQLNSTKTRCSVRSMCRFRKRTLNCAQKFRDWQIDWTISRDYRRWVS